MPQRRHRDVATEKLSRFFYQSLNCILKTSPCLPFSEQFDPVVSSFLAGSKGHPWQHRVFGLLSHSPLTISLRTECLIGILGGCE